MKTYITILYQFCKNLLKITSFQVDAVHLIFFQENFFICLQYLCGPGSVVGIATGYGLDGPGIESRWGARFSAPVQTGSGSHPASCTMGTRSFPGVKSGRGVTLTPHPPLVPWSWESRAIPLLPLQAVRSVQSLSARTRVHLIFFYFSALYFSLHMLFSKTNIELCV
jgi:hypothetical protein